MSRLLIVGALCSVAVLGGAEGRREPQASQAGPRENKGSRSTIAFASTRDHPEAAAPFLDFFEIYVMKGDGTDVRRLTDNSVGDFFPKLSPDGSRIIFESNRRRAAGEPLNVSDLFIMNADGSDQTWLTRGSSATWSPDGMSIAFHASVSGTGLPANSYPGSATLDSDIFIAKVQDLLAKKATPRNLTNNPQAVDDDPDWSPDGRTILFTSHATGDNHTNAISAEIYSVSVEGSAGPKPLTSNKHEERAPAWSPDGKRVLFCCRRGSKPDFDLCVMNADGSGEAQVTASPLGDLTPSWSPDGRKILFHRAKGAGLGAWDLWLVNPDGTGEVRLTNAPGHTGFASWGETGRKVER